MQRGTHNDDVKGHHISDNYCIDPPVIRAVAPSPAMAGPVFAAGTKILNIEDMHSKHIFILGGGHWPEVEQRSKSRVVLLQCCRT